MVEHDYEFAKGEQKWFLLERNRWLTVLGAYPRPLLAALLPALLAAELAFFARRGARRLAGREAARGGRRAARAARPRCGGAARCRRPPRSAPSEFAAALTAGLDSPFLGPAAQIAPARRRAGRVLAAACAAALP